MCQKIVLGNIPTVKKHDEMINMIVERSTKERKREKEREREMVSKTLESFDLRSVQPW